MTAPITATAAILPVDLALLDGYARANQRGKTCFNGDQILAAFQLTEGQVSRRRLGLVARGLLVAAAAGGKGRYHVTPAGQELLAQRPAPAVAALAQQRGAKAQRCLCCRHEFLSEGSHNRLCPACTRAAATHSGIDVHTNGGTRKGSSRPSY